MYTLMKTLGNGTETPNKTRRGITARVLDLEPDPNDKVFAVLVTFKKDDGEEYKKLHGPFFDDGHPIVL